MQLNTLHTLYIPVRLLIVATLFIVSMHLYASPVNSKKILVLGDSLSMGHGLAHKQGWVDLMQERLIKLKYPYQVINASIGGDTTSSGLARSVVDIEKYQPSIILIELGGNDGLRGLSLVQTEENLDKIIDLAKKKKAQILLLGIEIPPNYGPLYTTKFKQIYKDLAKKHNIEHLPFLLEGIAGNKNLMQADGIHPNQKAQHKVLANVWPKLKPLLSKAKKN